MLRLATQTSVYIFLFMSWLVWDFMHKLFRRWISCHKMLHHWWRWLQNYQQSRASSPENLTLLHINQSRTMKRAALERCLSGSCYPEYPKLFIWWSVISGRYYVIICYPPQSVSILVITVNYQMSISFCTHNTMKLWDHLLKRKAWKQKQNKKLWKSLSQFILVSPSKY